jgi:hypothetical protein
VQKWVSVRVDWLQDSRCRRSDCWKEFIVRERERAGDFLLSLVFCCFFDEGKALGVFVAALVWGWR